MPAPRNLCALVLLAALLNCGLPPAWEPAEGERFWTLISVQRWARDDAPVGAETADVSTHTLAAVVTWRLGREAPLPRAWWASEACLVQEGSWRDTSFTPPASGPITFTGDTFGSKVLPANRIGFGFEAADAWMEGSSVSMEATGGALPGFSFRSTVPDEPTLTTWDLRAVKAGQITLSRAQPLTVQWLPRSGRVLLLLLQGDRTPFQDAFHGIYCAFPADLGQGTVPLAALATFLDASQISFAQLSFSSLTGERRATERAELEWAVWNGWATQVVWQ